MSTRTRLLVAGLLVLGTAACTEDATPPTAEGSTPAQPPATAASPGAVPGGTGPSTAEPSTAGPGTGAAVPACVTGGWRATGVTSSGTIGDVRGRIAGGTGTTMTVGPDGRTEVGFQAAQPVTFAAEAAGADVQGQVGYAGSFRGTVRFEPARTPGSGRWIPDGKIAWSDLRATVKLTEPFAVTLLDGANLADLSGETLPGPSGAVDIQPILRGGTYRCADDTLHVETRDNGPMLTWTFTRA